MANDKQCDLIYCFNEFHTITAMQLLYQFQQLLKTILSFIVQDRTDPRIFSTQPSEYKGTYPDKNLPDQSIRGLLTSSAFFIGMFAPKNMKKHT